jgi:hypothetical protein
LSSLKLLNTGDISMAFGQEENTSEINLPGTYTTPDGTKELTVIHNAAADALVRMGWIRKADAEGQDAPDPERTPAMAAEQSVKKGK